LVVLIAVRNVSRQTPMELVVVGMLFGLPFGLVNLLAVWAALGGTRWPVRVSGLLVGLALEGATLREVVARETWVFTAIAIIQTAGLMVVLSALRLWGWRIDWVHDPIASDEFRAKSRLQLSTRDLLMWAAASALLLGLSRSLGPIDLRGQL